jgi:hypothetical protein
MQLFEVDREVTVDAIAYVKGGTIAGNVRVGIYGPIPTEDTADAAPLAIESSSTAQSAGTNNMQLITITATRLRKGRYYVAIQSDDGTATYLRYSNQNITTGFSQFYDRSGGYGAFTDPCPTPTNSGSAMPYLSVRCSG